MDNAQIGVCDTHAQYVNDGDNMREQHVRTWCGSAHGSEGAGYSA
jgi:hypothetical protein